MSISPQKLQQQLQGKHFGYNNSEGSWVQGKVKNIQNINGNQMIVMEDSTMFEVPLFHEMVIPLDDLDTGNEQQEFDQIPEGDGLWTSESEEPRRNNKNGPPEMQMRFDANGFPILPTVGDGEENEEYEQEHTHKNNTKPKLREEKQPPAPQIQKDPITILLESAKLEDSKITIEFTIPTINKGLFSTIDTSFNDEKAREKMYDFMIGKINSDETRKSIIEELSKYFN